MLGPRYRRNVGGNIMILGPRGRDPTTASQQASYGSVGRRTVTEMVA